MGTIGEFFSLKKSKAKCTFCEVNKPHAFWHGKTIVYVCINCAVDRLPKLIADAFVQYFGDNKTKINNTNISQIQLRLSKTFIDGIYAYGARKVTETKSGIRPAQEVIDEALGKK